MDYILNSFINENKNNVNNKNNNKLLNIIGTSISVEKREKFKNLSNNKNINNYSLSPKLNNNHSKDFKNTSQIKRKRILKKNYININQKKSISLKKNNNNIDNNSFNFNNTGFLFEKNMCNEPINNIYEYKTLDLNSSRNNTVRNDFNKKTFNKKTNNNIITVKNKEKIKNLLYNEKESKSNLIDIFPKENKYFFDKYSKKFNYFNYCSEASRNKNNYEKVSEINNYKTFSLFNELNDSLKKNLDSNIIINENKTINQEHINRGKYFIENNNISDRKVNENRGNFLYRKINISNLKRNKINTDFSEDKIYNTYDDNNLTERERYPKSIYINKLNKSIIFNMNNNDNRGKKFKSKENFNSKEYNKNITYSRKICPVHNKPSQKNNYIMLSSNLNLIQISKIINNYCEENKLNLEKNKLKYIITVKKINSFVIKINIIEGNCVLKFMHKNGDSNKTKDYINGLFFKIAN